MGVVGSFSRVCAALLAVRWRFRRHQCRNATMFGSLRRFSLVLNAFIASPFGLQRRQSMTRQTIYRRPVFRKARRQFDRVAAYSTCRLTRATGCSIRRARWPPPVRYIGTRAASPCSRGYRVESLISRIFESLPREWSFHRALSPSRTPFGNKPFELACANRVRNGRSDRCLV